VHALPTDELKLSVFMNWQLVMVGSTFACGDQRLEPLKPPMMADDVLSMML
jgi:hypothetical protein